MPTTVTASNGNTYHLWQLPPESTPEPTDVIEFTTLENELSQGFRSSVLIGSNTGVRSWQLTVPTLAGGTVIAAAVTSVTGATVSREDYLRTLYAYNRTTGIPFAYQDNGDGQYYLVDFVAQPLAMQKAKGVDIYSTSVELRQRRIQGVTVFDVTKMPSTGYGYDWYKETGHGAGVWTASDPLPSTMTATGDVVFSGNPQNGLNTVRLNGTGANGFLTGNYQLFFEMFMVLKMRETTFSNNAGVLTTPSSRVLIGGSGTTKFQNLAATNYTYRLNGVEYTQANQQAPMDEWGVVHVRKMDSYDPEDAAQIGKDQSTAGTFAKADVGEFIVFGAPISTHESRELTEYLMTKWGIA